jgi:hypothetical protein
MDSTFSWELRDLPPIKKEPLSPSFANLVPRIAINYAPAEGNRDLNRVFADWVSVSRWASSLQDPEVIVDDALAAKARELTAGAKSELEMIRAIGSYVQKDPVYCDRHRRWIRKRHAAPAIKRGTKSRIRRL